jgi:hypothetical protein
MANIFREKRKELNMTQKQFSVLTGNPVRIISNMENCGCFNLEHATKFCNVFHPEFVISGLRVIKRSQ